MTDNQPILPPFKYGSFSTRMLASTLDLGVLLMLVVPIVEYLMEHMFVPADMNNFIAILGAPGAGNNAPQVISDLWQDVLRQHLLERIIVENLLQIGFIALYILPFWFYFSTTPAKMLFRLRIVDAKTGLPMSRRQSVIRFLGYIVSTIPFSLGFLWIAFNKKRRGFHDLIAGTIVVKKPLPPSVL